ncbi:hypothetical protein MYXO_00252 [Myxococcaceae bacterium]|nr:hypothetical protein MYXO_00252 [Myxococcaceae bacterium]
MTTQINQAQIALYHPQNVGDFAESGGHVTSRRIDPLKADEIFGDLTDWAVVDGEVGIRSFYVGIDSDNAAVYSHGHVFIAKGSDNPNVHLTLFSTGRHGDTRADLQNYLEGAGMVQGAESRWVLKGDHIPNMGTIRAFSITNARGPEYPVQDARPDINDIIMLSVESPGLPVHKQYFRVVKILSDNVVIETDQAGDFYKSVIVIQLSQRLDQNYPGVDQVVRYTAFARKTLIRTTQYADALEAKGIKRLEADIPIGSTALKVDGLFSTLVPRSVASDPIVNEPLLPGNVTMAASGAAGSLSASAALSASVGPVYAATLHLGSPFLPNSLALLIDGVAHQDDGQGGVTGPTGTLYSGTADYAGRKVIVTKESAWTATVSATATPAAPIDNTSFTAAIDVTANNLSSDWVENLNPPPAPGTVVAEYKASQRWHRLADDAKGHLLGAEGTGAGSADYTTGDAVLSTAAYADIGSKILWSWGTRQQATNRAGTTLTLTPAMLIDLAHAPRPGTYAVSWLSGGVTKTATANAYGDLGGDATGRLLASAKKVWLQPAQLPDSNSEFSSAYDWGAISSETFNPVIRAGGAAGEILVGMNNTHFVGGINVDVGMAISFYDWNNGIQTIVRASLDDATSMTCVLTTASPMLPGSVHVKYPLGHVGVTLASTGDETDMVELVDDGLGKLKVAGGPGVLIGLVLTASAVDYVNKTLTIPVVLPPNGIRYGWTLMYWNGVSYPVPAYGPNPFIWKEGSAVSVSYQVDTGTPTTVTGETAAVPPLEIDLAPGTSNPIAPASVRFGLGGSHYVDLDGALARDIDPATGSGTASGEIHYDAGKALVTSWPSGSGSTVTVTALATVNGLVSVANVAGRVSAPLAPGQFIVRATGIDGTAVHLSTNINGVISGDWGAGLVDWTSGIFGIRFGRWLAESSPLWQGSPTAYADAEHGTPDPAIRWRPLQVIPSLGRYDAVAQSYLPISSARLGIQVERLPPGGEVQSFRAGDMCVIHRRHTVTLPNPVVADAVIELGEPLVTWARLLDANGLEVPTTEYSATPAQLDLGRIVIAPSVNLAGFTQPLVAEYGIEDLVKLTDNVNVSGDLEFHPETRHAYYAANSHVSGALFIGDRQARITLAFELANFSQGWTDTPYGATILAQYDSVGFPLVVKNFPAPTERFLVLYTGTTTFDCYGEISGLVGSGTTTEDFFVTDRASGRWYIQIKHQGWGGNWSPGQGYRFNYESAAFPLAMVRAAVSGSANSTETDNFRIGLRGYSNRV